MGLNSGRLAAGAQADFILVDPDAPTAIDPQAFKSATKNSPFEGLPVQGKVLLTVAGGKTIFASDHAH